MSAPRLAATAWLLAALGCGYTTRVVGPGGGDLLVHVPQVEAPGIDVDAAGLVDARLRRAVARAAGLALAPEVDAQVVLHVEVLEVRAGLSPFAEPALRAAQYEATVRLRGRLARRDGGPAWRSAPVTGRDAYLSTAGPIERLDGAGRRALARAAEDAAERLVAAMVLHLRAPPATGTSTAAR